MTTSIQLCDCIHAYEWRNLHITFMRWQLFRAKIENVRSSPEVNRAAVTTVSRKRQLGVPYADLCNNDSKFGVSCEQRDEKPLTVQNKSLCNELHAPFSDPATANAEVVRRRLCAYGRARCRHVSGTRAVLLDSQTPQ